MSTSEEFKFEQTKLTFSDANQKQMSNGSVKGLNWTWNLYSNFSPIGTLKKLEECVFFTWTFEWEELRKTGILGFQGTIGSRYYIGSNVIEISSKLELMESGKTIERRIEKVEIMRYCLIHNGPFCMSFGFILSLKPIRAADIINKFPSTEMSDAILVVEGFEMHVNRTFLSLHSEYFRALFNSDFKEKSMEKVPIEDVKHRDFERLLAVVEPICEFFNDDDLESLLKLADRFVMRGVAHRVKHHLMTASQLPLAKILKFADEYQMENVVKYCMNLIITSTQLKKIKMSPDFVNLSNLTKLKFLDLIDKVL